MIKELKKKYPKTYKKIVVYLGNDEELNGTHTGWCCDIVDKDNVNYEDFKDVININGDNNPLKEVAVLIS